MSLAESNNTSAQNGSSPNDRPPRFSLRFLLLAVAGVALLLGLALELGVIAAAGLACWMLTCLIWQATRVSLAGILFTITGTAVLLLAAFLNYASDGPFDLVGILPFAMAGAIATISGSLVFAGTARMQSARRKGNTCGAAAGMLALLLAIVVVYPISEHLADVRRARGIGPVTVRSEFPAELQALLKAAEREQIVIEQLDVFCQTRGFDDEYYWKAKASPELIDLITSLWKLSASDKRLSQVQAGWQRVPPSHIAPSTHETELYIGSGGPVVFVVHDKTDELLYFHYICDF